MTSMLSNCTVAKINILWATCLSAGKCSTGTLWLQRPADKEQNAIRSVAGLQRQDTWTVCADVCVHFCMWMACDAQIRHLFQWYSRLLEGDMELDWCCGLDVKDYPITETWTLALSHSPQGTTDGEREREWEKKGAVALGGGWMKREWRGKVIVMEKGMRGK